MKKLLFACLGCVLIALSCKKSDPAPNPVPATPSKFFTFTPGVSWYYQTDSATVNLGKDTLTSSAKDSLINSKLYHVFDGTGTSGTYQSFYNITGRDYYQYTSLSAQLPPLDLRYLNDSLPVLSNWSQPVSVSQSGATLTGDIKNTIAQKGISLTVNGTAYDSVIMVRTTIENANIVFSGQNIPPSITQDIQNFYAPRHGLIKRLLKLNISIAPIPIFLPNGQEIINTNRTTSLMNSTVQ
jgi:hypothetical protein